MVETNTKEDNFVRITNFIEIEQPIGTFILCSLRPEELLKISKPEPRRYEGLNKYVGIQRQIDEEKIRELKSYIKTDDASFPNSIIANLDTQYIKSYKKDEIKIKIKDNDQPNEKALFIIDGQHRLKSFEGEETKNFNLIVAIYLGLSIEEQAYLFATINNKQKKLQRSLVQDLNDLFEIETPEKVVHVLTKFFNEKETPWKNQIKILGKNIKKDDEKLTGIMSQYSFSKGIIKFIVGESKDYFEIRDILKNSDNRREMLKTKFKKHEEYSKKFIFWNYYVESKENYIYNSLLSYFESIRDNFKGWGNKDYITTKTTGYFAFMDFYEFLFREESDKAKLLKKDYFDKIFKKMHEINILDEMTSEKYESGIKGQRKLLEHLKSSYQKVFTYS